MGSMNPPQTSTQQEAEQNAAIVPQYATATAAAAESSAKPICYVLTTNTLYFYCAIGGYTADNLSCIDITVGGQWVGIAGRYSVVVNIVNGTFDLNGVSIESLFQIMPAIKGNFWA